MKILFIDPPHKPWTFFPGIIPSPGLLAIIPMVFQTNTNHQIFILDLTLKENKILNLINICNDFNPDIIAISGAKSAFAYETLNTAALIRKFLPNKIIIGGGNFLSSYADEVISRGFFDIIATSEGEIVFKNLLNLISNNQFDEVIKLNGIAYIENLNNKYIINQQLQTIFNDYCNDLEILKDDFFYKNIPFRLDINFKCFFNKAVDLIKNLDELPLPAFEYFDMDKYTVPPLGGKIGFVISLSRGCFKKCSFCADSVFWNHIWRGFSAKRAIEILKILYYGYGRKIFYIGDDDFFQNKERNIEFLELLEFERKNGFEINFWIQSSVENILKNKDLINRYRKIGLYQIMCGFETIASDTQKSFNKNISIEKMKEVSKILHKNNVLLMGMLMWGDYEDTYETLIKTLEFMTKYCDIIGPNTVLAHYNTKYFEKCSKLFNISKFDVLQNDQCQIIFPTKSLNVKEASSIYRDNVLKTLISKKKFIGNYFLAKNKRILNVISDLCSKGFDFSELKKYSNFLNKN